MFPFCELLTYTDPAGSVISSQCDHPVSLLSCIPLCVASCEVAVEMSHNKDENKYKFSHVCWWGGSEGERRRE